MFLIPYGGTLVKNYYSVTTKEYDSRTTKTRRQCWSSNTYHVQYYQYSVPGTVDDVDLFSFGPDQDQRLGTIYDRQSTTLSKYSRYPRKGIDTMKHINRKLYVCCQLSQVLCKICSKWFSGALLQKLIQEGFRSAGASIGSSSALFEVIFLQNLSFYSVLLLLIAAFSVLNLSRQVVHYLANRKALYTGRSIRSEIAEKAVTQSGDSEDISQQANELLNKIRIIEDFVEHDECQFLINFASMVLCTAFCFVFAWYVGLLAAGLFLVVKFIELAFNKLRRPFLGTMEESYNQVNARLLDVIKNGVKVKVMGQSSYERQMLVEMEEASDEARSKEIAVRLVSLVNLPRWSLLTRLPVRPKLLMFHVFHVID